jgi:hypothetical protein
MKIKTLLAATVIIGLTTSSFATVCFEKRPPAPCKKGLSLEKRWAPAPCGVPYTKY